MDPNISPLCRFCLEHREEFNLLATECPTLWWERHEISAQEITEDGRWSPDQIVDFSMIPKINECFVKPLYILEANVDHQEVGFRSQQHHYPEVTNDVNDDPDEPPGSDLDTDISVMDVSSMETSSNQDENDSDVSILSIE